MQYHRHTLVTSKACSCMLPLSVALSTPKTTRIFESETELNITQKEHIITRNNLTIFHQMYIIMLSWMSDRVARASATETVESGPIPGQVKLKTIRN